MIDTERLMMIPARMDEHDFRDPPYRQMCLAAVAAALDAEVGLEIAIAQLTREARRMSAPVRANVANAVAA